jgi:6-phosphogluconolactonase
LLGIGEDGHTASLFPDIASSEEDGHLAVAVSPPDITKDERITLTFPVINNADNIMLLAAGVNKAEIIKEVVEEEDSLLPAAMIRPQKGKLFFLLDKSAGSLLSESIQ